MYRIPANLLDHTKSQDSDSVESFVGSLFLICLKIALLNINIIEEFPCVQLPVGNPWVLYQTVQALLCRGGCEVNAFNNYMHCFSLFWIYLHLQITSKYSNLGQTGHSLHYCWCAVAGLSALQ